MNQRQRMKWDAEAAFKRIERQESDVQKFRASGAAGVFGPIEIDPECMPHRRGWTPAPDPRAYMKAKPDVYKGRDYEALTKAALRKPVGYYEDAPHGIKFGGKPLLSATTNPHGKDVDTADGPWPKWAIATTGNVEKLWRIDGTKRDCCGHLRYAGACYEPNSVASCGSTFVIESFRASEWRSEATALEWLEAHGHKDVAAQLRGKATTPPADDEFEPVGTMPAVGDKFEWGGDVRTVSRIDPSREFSVRFATVTGEDGVKMGYFDKRLYEPLRILKRPTKPRDDVATGARVWKNTVSGVVWARIGGMTFCGPVDSQPWSREKHCDGLDPGAVYVELHGPERDALIAECRKAMGI